jgi:hypothetical protein
MGNTTIRSISGVSQHPTILDSASFNVKYFMGYNNILYRYKIVRFLEKINEPLLMLLQLELTMIGEKWVFPIWWFYLSRGYQTKVSRLWNLVLTIWSINRVTYISFAKMIMTGMNSFVWLSHWTSEKTFTSTKYFRCSDFVLFAKHPVVLICLITWIHQSTGNNDRMLLIKSEYSF